MFHRDRSVRTLFAENKDEFTVQPSNSLDLIQSKIFRISLIELSWILNHKKLTIAFKTNQILFSLICASFIIVLLSDFIYIEKINHCNAG